MSDTRRELLASGLAALPRVVDPENVVAPAPGAAPTFSTACQKPGAGPNAGYLPNMVLETHTRQRVMFYDDLLLGRIVLLHFMATPHSADDPLLKTLAQVQPWLGDRLGRDIFLYSLSSDPEYDTPQALAALAQHHGARPGWLFLTGPTADLELLRGRLFAHNGPHNAHGQARDCSEGLARYGNESIGLWGSVPTRSNPGWIAHRLSWLVPREPPSGPPRRGGPPPLPRAVREHEAARRREESDVSMKDATQPEKGVRS